MRGFDGDPARASALGEALAAVLAAFPEHLPKPRPPREFDGRELASNEQFDAILRAHKRDRLAIPIQALRATGAPYHGFHQVHLRRLAWFVPSILASWLARAPGPADAPFGAADIEAITSEVRDDRAEGEAGGAWTEEEAAALDAFFEAALDAALATPLPPPREPAAARPLEDGVRVWSLHSPSVPLDVLRVARALGVALDPLVTRWALDPEPLALDHLLEAVYDTTVAAKHYLAAEPVADRLGDAFFDATGERQARLSKAEATVRRNLARREEL